jgi:hypothetical protein
MTQFQIFLVLVSTVLFMLVAVLSWVRTRRHTVLAFELLGLGVVLLFLHIVFDFTAPLILFGPPKGVLIGISYAFVLLGMAAQYLFTLSEKPKRSRRFDIWALLKPFLISPIVFLPLVGLVSRSQAETLSERDVFVWANAFQNGFFWRVIYERLQKSSARASLSGTPGSE